MAILKLLFLFYAYLFSKVQISDVPFSRRTHTDVCAEFYSILYYQ